MHSASLKSAPPGPSDGSSPSSPRLSSPPCCRGAAERGLGSCPGDCGRNMDSAKWSPGRPPLSELYRGLAVSGGPCGSKRGGQAGDAGHCSRAPRRCPRRLHVRESAQPVRAVSRPPIHHRGTFTSKGTPPTAQARLPGIRGERRLFWATRLSPYAEGVVGWTCTASVTAATAKVLAVLQWGDSGGKGQRDLAHGDLGCFSPPTYVAPASGPP
ncbi:uncharacterized protein LOC144100315 [Amblyomma americanum]